MLIRLLAVGQRAPQWVSAGFEDYARRLPPSCRLELVELATISRGGNRSADQIMVEEARRIGERLGKDARRVALDQRGSAWSSRQLCARLDDWLQSGRDVDLLVGGANGLHPDLRAGADEQWSLSALTLPHMLVRVVVAEALYRAHSMLHNHPYHRA